MNVDDIGKLMLTFAVVFAIIGISIQLMRLIDRLVGTVEETNKTIKNANVGITQVLEDYLNIRKAFSGLGELVKPISLLTAAIAAFSAKNSKSSSKTE